MSTKIEWTQYDLDRFNSKVQKTGQCWNWTAGTDSSGYGKFSLKNRSLKASRFAFLVANGSLPKVVRHTCDNRLCVRPDHLLPGDHHDNNLDTRERGGVTRTSPVHAPTKRLKRTDGERNGRAILTAAQVSEIRTRYASSERTSLRMLAKEYGVSKSLIQRIIQRKIWNTKP